MESYAIYGAGGHAKVIVDLIKLLDGHIECIFDDNYTANPSFVGIPVHQYDPEQCKDAKIIIAIGDNEVRKTISAQLSHRFATLIHPTASISSSARIGAGTVVLANAVVSADAKIGNHVIINTLVSVDHEVIINDYVHVFPNAYLGGRAIVQEGAVIGPGSVVMRKAIIPQSAIIDPLSLVNL